LERSELGVGVGNFGKVGVGVRNFTSDFATLLGLVLLAFRCSLA